jgi:hypothetical protein
MRDAVQTARAALAGDLTDIMMTTREEERVMASIARLDAQLHSTAANRYSKGSNACPMRLKHSFIHRRRIGRLCHARKARISKSGVPQLSAQCRIGAAATMGGVVICGICTACQRRAQPNELDERPGDRDARAAAADPRSVTSGTSCVLIRVCAQVHLQIIHCFLRGHCCFLTF